MWTQSLYSPTRGTLFKSRKKLKLPKIVIIFNTDFEIPDNATRHELQIKMNIGKTWMILPYVKLKN